MSDAETIQGVQRIAAFLLSLDGEKASAVLKKMKPDLVTRVAEAMLDLDPRLTESGVVDDLFGKMAKSLGKPRSISKPDNEGVRSLLDTALGAQGGKVFHDIQERKSTERPFAEVETYPVETIALVLRQESPTVAALALAHFDPSISANVLRFFEQDDSLEIIKLIAKLRPPGPDMLRTIASTLTLQLASTPVSSPKADPSERLKSIAEILSNSSPEVEKRVIETIGDMDPEMGQELREYMFTWEDISTIGKRPMQKILGAVDTKTLSMALKGASPEVEGNVMNNLSSRVKDMVAEERDLLGAVPISDVLDARKEVMTAIRALIEAGEFRPTRGSDELVT